MFRVRWEEEALNELPHVWMQADSAARRAITAATQSVDQRLRSQPERQGESRDEETRVFFVPPLGISFKVDSPQHLVSIAHVWSFRQRSR